MVNIGSYSRIIRTGVMISNWSFSGNARAVLPSQQLTGKVICVIQALLDRLVVFVEVHRNGAFDQLGDGIVDAFLESLGHDVTSNALLKDGDGCPNPTGAFGGEDAVFW